MKIFDISMAIDENMPVYKNKESKKPKLRVMQDFSTGHTYESRLEMDMHTGTHMDMPLHIIPDGKTMDAFDLSKVTGKCRVLDFTHIKDKITADDLKLKNIRSSEIILLKTRNSYCDIFDPEYVFLEASGAEYLKNAAIKTVGIDALGIERAQPGHETHKALLEKEIVIIEGLRLSEVEEGEYTIYALPLKISHAEAAPARVILIQDPA